MPRMELTLNGSEVSVEARGHWTLLQLLRDGLGAFGTKEGCGEGSCGACTVLVDGRLTRSCLALAVRAAGTRVLTIEGLARNGKLDPVQEAFVRHGANPVRVLHAGLRPHHADAARGAPTPERRGDSRVPER